MCMSVPQIAERRTLMRTSLWPTAGSGISCIQMPGSARALTNAFIACLCVAPVFEAPLANDAKRATRALERLYHPIELRARVRCAQLSADARFSVGYDRIGEGDHVDAFLLHPLGESHGERRLAEHDGNDRMFPGKQLVSQALHAVAKIAGIRLQPVAQLG